VRTLTVSDQPFLAGGDAYSALVLQSSPEGYWPLTETAGTTAVDLSGNARNGTYTGGYVLADTQLANNLLKSVTLDGTEDYVNIADAAGEVWSPTGSSGELTVEAWIKPSAVNRSAAMIFAKHRGWQLRIESDGKVLWDLNNNGTTTVMTCTSASALTAGTVYHVVGVYNRATPKVELFIDGTSVASSTSASSNVLSTSEDLQIGRRADNGGNEFIGTIGYVALYRTALSSAVIASHNTLGRA